MVPNTQRVETSRVQFGRWLPGPRANRQSHFPMVGRDQVDFEILPALVQKGEGTGELVAKMATLAPTAVLAITLGPNLTVLLWVIGRQLLCEHVLEGLVSL